MMYPAIQVAAPSRVGGDIEIRPAGVGDVEGLAGLFSAAYADSSHPCQDPSFVRSTIASPSFPWRVAAAGARIVAWSAVVEHAWNRTWEIGRGVTHPDYRNEGTGASLCQQCVSAACPAPTCDLGHGYPRNAIIAKIAAQARPSLRFTGHDGGISVANGTREYHGVIVGRNPDARFPALRAGPKWTQQRQPAADNRSQGTGDPMKESSGQTMLEALWIMLRAREGDRRENLLFRQSLGWLQLPGAGHEATAALALALDPADLVFPHYRDRALMLARGASTYDLALGYFAKADSSSAGRQMPSHFSSRAHNVMSVASPTGLQCLPAAGAAWALQLEGRGRIVLCCLGDATMRQGEFYEAWCFAVQQKLPVVFAVEDNRYGISTPTEGMNPLRLNVLARERVRAVDGSDVAEVLAAARDAVARTRAGEGPFLLWMQLERLMSHTSSDDQRIYRSPEDLAAAALRDPIARAKEALLEAGLLTEEAYSEAVNAIAQEVDSDYRRAAEEPDPEAARVRENLFSSVPSRASRSLLPNQESWTIVAAINTKLGQLLERDPRVVLFGEDIADPKGGVFGLTKGLSTRFPDRVFNSPLAEATIAGIAAGLALADFRPVFELQFIDFVGPAVNQIVNQIATLRWRTNGDWRCPLVLLAPCGGYLPAGGTWHSQTNEGWFAHVPGLKVLEPSTPLEAAALLELAASGDDPVLLLLPKHQFRVRHMTGPDRQVAIGRGNLRRPGDDVTLVAWGNCVTIALEAAAFLAREEIDAEVIDLMSLVPLDWDMIQRSVRTTGRLVVIEEDNRTGSLGQAIISDAACDAGLWRFLKASPVLLARPNVHVPFHPRLELAILPSTAAVVEAVRELVINSGGGR